MYITNIAMALFAASAGAADVSEVWTDATSFGAMLARGDVIAKRQGYVTCMYEVYLGLVLTSYVYLKLHTSVADLWLRQHMSRGMWHRPRAMSLDRQ
jgi:hypothetical protein